MLSTLKRYTVFSAIMMSISACSSIPLDNNAAKIQKQPTSYDHKYLIPIHQVSADGIGGNWHSILPESPSGLIITPALWKLPSGEHGFHIHEKPSCEAASRKMEKWVQHWQRAVITILTILPTTAHQKMVI